MTVSTFCVKLRVAVTVSATFLVAFITASVARPLAFFALLSFASAAFAEQPCCWIDTKTGKPVATFPVITDPNGEPGHKTDWIRPDASDPNRAYDPRTGRNFAKDDAGCWIDTKTGKRVAALPVITDPNGEPGHKTDWIRPDPSDPNRAFDPKTGRNFARVACPENKTAKPTPTPSTTNKVTNILKTIGGSVSIGIGGGGDDHRHHGEDRHRTADKVSTDKTKTHTTSPTTTHKTVTAGCKCHPCTCSPCTCH
jgi:hypothetical protein